MKHKYLIYALLVAAILSAFFAAGTDHSYVAKVFEVGVMKAGSDPWVTTSALLFASAVFCVAAGVFIVRSSRIRRRAHMHRWLGVV